MYIGKSVAHLNIQLHLKSLIPGIQLEKPMSQIGRIADSYWEKEKIVFEIQASFISLKEVEKRCLDYKSIGLTPVWILHTRRFNKKYTTPAEAFLRSTQICYFTDGYQIYDQAEVLDRNLRVFRGPPLGVNLAAPLREKESLFFEGSLKERLKENPDRELAKRIKRARNRSGWLRRAYQELFYFLLSQV